MLCNRCQFSVSKEKPGYVPFRLPNVITYFLLPSARDHASCDERLNTHGSWWSWLLTSGKLEKYLFYYKYNTIQCPFMPRHFSRVENFNLPLEACFTSDSRRNVEAVHLQTTDSQTRLCLAIIFTRGLSRTKESVGVYPRSNSFCLSRNSMSNSVISAASTRVISMYAMLEVKVSAKDC